MRFLDVSGPWDPSLAFAMAGALAGSRLGVVAMRARPAAPLLAPAYQLPDKCAPAAPMRHAICSRAARADARRRADAPAQDAH